MRRKSRVCVIRRGSYPNDPRLYRTVHALLEDGHAVDLICTAEPGWARRESRGALSIRRLRVPSSTGGGARLLVHYLLFSLAAAALVTFGHARRRFSLVHVQSLPDPLVFVAAIPRLLGARVLLDLSEPGPEYYRTRFGLPARHPMVRLLVALEQLSIRFADRAVTCTHHMRDVFVGRGADAAKLDVVHLSAHESVFDVDHHPPRGSGNGDFVLVSHGTIERRYGLGTVIRAIAELRDELPGLRLEVYGTGSQIEPLAALAEALGVGDRVWFSRSYVPISRLLEAIARADAGVVAMRRDAYRDVTHCNKMFEFVAMRRPLLMSRTRSVQDYFGDSCFEYFESGDHEDLAEAIRRLHDDPARREGLVQRAAAAFEPYRWEGQRAVYLQSIRELTASAALSSASKRAAKV